MISNTTDSTFAQDTAAGAVLVDCWADWCGPCKSLAPTLETVADSYGEKLKVLKLDVDANPVTPEAFHVRGIPTLILFIDGKPVGTKVGNVSKSQLTAFLDTYL